MMKSTVLQIGAFSSLLAVGISASPLPSGAVTLAPPDQLSIGGQVANVVFGGVPVPAVFEFLKPFSCGGVSSTIPNPPPFPGADTTCDFSVTSATGGFLTIAGPGTSNAPGNQFIGQAAIPGIGVAAGNAVLDLRPAPVSSQFTNSTTAATGANNLLTAAPYSGFTLVPIGGTPLPFFTLNNPNAGGADLVVSLSEIFNVLQSTSGGFTAIGVSANVVYTTTSGDFLGEGLLTTNFPVGATDASYSADFVVEAAAVPEPSNLVGLVAAVGSGIFLTRKKIKIG